MRLLHAAFIATLLLTSPSWASILPVITDASGETEASWWLDDDVGELGALTHALLSESTSSDVAWQDPRPLGRSLASVSRVLRTPELTATNGARLADLLGATRVVVGRVDREEVPNVSWLGLFRTSLVIRASVADARTGSIIRDISLRAVAFGTSRDEATAAAAVLLARFLRQSVSDVSTRAVTGLPLLEGRPVVVLRGDGTALPYVAVRTAIRDVHPGVIELTEFWATEGHVAIEVALDEAVEWGDFVRSLHRMTGAELDGVVVASISDLVDGSVLMQLRSRPPSLSERAIVPPR